MKLFVDLSIIAMLLAGIRMFRSPRGARFGNLTAALALLFAFFAVLFRYGLDDPVTVAIALAAGSAAGYLVAKAVGMIQIPSMVAFQHGAGGVAAFLVSFVELTRSEHFLEPAARISGVLGLTIGALTFSGSIIASAKLAGKMKQTPQILPAHSTILGLNLAILAAIGTISYQMQTETAFYFYILQILAAGLFGILFSVRIGGADMPVLISFLNATAGLAAAFCGMVIESRLLIAFGATVAASGSILTYVMCEAMNRSVLKVFLPRITVRAASRQEEAEGVSSRPGVPADPGPARDEQDQFAIALDVVKSARTVIIIPGYGMALAKAQQALADFAVEMTHQGKEVKYAIHPVAGRMPGHMNVLLAEAGVDYDLLVEMDQINPCFGLTDLVLIVGACDVVNPSAMETEGTPISGMPILLAHEASHVICCNLDRKPGYSGVENPLYEKSNTISLFGDAKSTLERLTASLVNQNQLPADLESPAHDTTIFQAVKALAGAKRIVIIPGYGTALAKAHFSVVHLASKLSGNGATVKYAIHPVAGRMPGHMNVILAEAEVDYDDLVEMDEANLLFAQTDVALVVGACDVVNPAAIQTEGTPISGMPILMAHEAGKVIVCNFDRQPGYSGVANPLYDDEKTLMLLGDAKASLDDLIALL